MGLPYDEQGLPSAEITLAEVLQERGYQTAHIGKWHLGRARQMLPNAQGFNDSLLMDSGLYLPEDDAGVVNARLDFDSIDRFLWAAMRYSASFNGSERFAPGGYLTDYWTDESIRFIDANRDGPFFLYLAHWGVHTPLQAKREDYEAVGDLQPHRLRVYAAMIRALDRSVSRILDHLDRSGLSENTLLLFTSDNGGAGYVGLPEINAPYRGWKITLFEGGIRVPFFLRWPGQTPAGAVVDTPVAHIDVMPTLAAAAQASLPAERIIDGVNLTPLWRGGTVERQDDALYWSSGAYRVVRAGDWKLQHDGLQGKRWLFDLATDPEESVNLIDERPEVAARLQALAEEHWRDAVPPLYPHTLEAGIAVDKTLAEPLSADDEYVIWPN